jgi:hypothetical protein
VNVQTQISEEQKAVDFAVVLENHKGFSVRKCKKGFLAFKDGRNLCTQPTVEDAIRSIDEQLEWENRRRLAEEERKAEQTLREARLAKEEAQKLVAILACIRPVRNFVESHGLAMLKECVQQLELEERDRNVPANWKELVEVAERIGELRCEEDNWQKPDRQVGEVDVDKYGVVEHRHWNSDADEYMTDVEYGLQEYIDEFSEDYLPQDEEEPSLRHIACFADIQNESMRQERMLEASGV